MGRDLFAEVAFGDPAAGRGQRGERLRHRPSGQQTQEQCRRDEHQHHCAQHPVAPVVDAGEFIGGILPGRHQVRTLRIEKRSQLVEFDLAAGRGLSADDVGRVGLDLFDHRLGIVVSPIGGGSFDGVQIGDQIGSVRQSLPNVLGRHALGPLTVVVGTEELRIRRNQVAAHPGFLVTQRHL